MLQSSWGGGGIQDHIVKGIAVISNGNKINNTHMKGLILSDTVTRPMCLLSLSRVCVITSGHEERVSNKANNA